MSKKTQDALRKYYSTFDYGTGVKAYKKGGRMGFKPNQHPWGGPNGTTWISEVDQTPVSEPGLDNLIALYMAENSGPWGGPQQLNPSVITDEKLKLSVRNPQNNNQLRIFTNSNDSARAGSWAGLAGVASNIIGDTVNSYKQMSDIDKEVTNRINTHNNSLYDNITDNSGLLLAAQDDYSLADVEAKTYRDKTWGQDVGSALSNGLSAGLATGNILVGAGVAAADFGKSLWQRSQAKSRAQAATELAKKKNIESGIRRSMAAQTVDSRNDWMRMMNYYNDPFEYALGGEMRTHGQDWNNGLTFIDAGGRHEDNPYEGVPSGVDDEGVPNLVEEGEVIWNNEYVFSDRLKVPDFLKKKYKLGGDLTFAEGITQVTKESLERPNDPISNETNRAIVNEWMDAQEELRTEEQQKAARQVQRAYDEDFMEQLSMLSANQQPAMDMSGAQLPPQGMIEEGMPVEGAPVGFAFGGNKFDNGSWKRYYTTERDENGNIVYVAPDGMKQYSEAGARKYAELNSNFWIEPLYTVSGNGMVTNTTYPTTYANGAVVGGSSRGSSGYVETSGGNGASGTTSGRGSRGETTLPNGLIAVRSKGKNAPVHHYETSDGRNMGTDLDRAIKAQNEINSKSKNIYDSESVSRFSGEYTPLEDWQMPGVSQAAKSTTTSTQTVPPAQEPVVETPQDGQQGSTTPPSAEDIKFKDDTTKKAADSYLKSKGVSKYSDLTDSQKAEYVRIASGTQKTGRTGGSGNTGGGSANSSSRSDIDYNRKLSAKESKEWEANKDYQDFLKYMRSNSNSPEAKQWMDFIQSEIKSSGSSYTLQGFDDWSKLAEDGKIGPVHQATLKAAQTYQKRANAPQLEGPTLVNNNNPVYQTPGKKKGVTAADVDNSIAELNAATNPQSPQFNYKDTWQRNVPIWAGLAGAAYGMLGSPNYSNADAIIEASRAIGSPINIPIQTIGDYRKRKPFDERYLVNMANQNRAAAQRNMYNTSGGNRSMDMLGAMSLAHSNQQELGEIMRQAYLANRQDDAQVAEFNRGTNIQNMNAINQRNLSQAQLNSSRQQAALSGLSRGYSMRQSIKDAWDAATMESLNSTIASIGLKGRENEQDNMLMSMAEQGYFPWYYGDKGVLQFVHQAKGGVKKNKKRRF